MEDICCQLIVAQIDLVTQFQIRLDRIEAAVLQLVGLHLLDDSYAAALLLLVNQNARARIRNRAQRQVQLVAAIPAQRVEDVAGHALRVDPYHGRNAVDVSCDQDQRRLMLSRPVSAGVEALERQQAKLSPAGWEVDGCDLLQVGQRHGMAPYRWVSDQPLGRSSAE